MPRTRLLTLVLAAFATVPAVSQQPPKRPITFTDLMAMKRVSDPQISPSGKWVLFSVTDVSLQANTRTNHLWVVPLDGSKPEAQLTFGKSNETNGRISPDGHWLLYTSDVSGSSQLWLAPWNEATGELGSPRNDITNLSTEADGGIWSPDSHHILFTSSVYPECSTQQGVEKARTALASPQAALADQVNPGLTPDAAPGKLGQISTLVTSNLQPAAWPDEANCNKAKDDAASKSPVKAEIWTSLLYRHWNQYTGEKRSHILLADITDQLHPATNLRDLTPASNVGTAETPTFFLGAPIQYAWSPDSKEIAYTTNLDQVPAASTNNDIFTLSIDNTTDIQQSRTSTKPQKISTSPGSDDAPAYSPDGKYLAFRSQARSGFESDQFRLAIFDRTRHTIHVLMEKAVPPALPLLGAPAFPGWIDEFSWSGNSNYIYFASADRGEEPLFQINVEGNDFRRLGKVQGEWSGIQESKSGVLVGELVRINRPTEIAAVRSFEIDDSARTFSVDFGKSGPVPETTTPTIEPHWLTHLDDLLTDNLALAPLEPFWFPGANGTKVEGFLLRPPNFDPNKKYPLKFLMHGGPQTAWGDAWSYRWNWELMAASGYVVIGINRRGSTGYGQQFVDEVSGDWGGRAYQDLMLGLDFAEKKYAFIDKNRECALGASYGGFMADWVLTHTDRFQCIVTHDGMSDPESAFGTTEELWFPEWEFRPLAPKTATDPNAVVEQTQPSYPWDFNGKPDSQNPYRRWSAMLSIKNAKTPTLIIHSQRDYRLDISQGLELFTALQLRGIPSKFLYFPDEGHWVLKPKNSQLWNATVSDWVDRWTHTNKYASTTSKP